MAEIFSQVEVAVAGATGMVGQRFVEGLHGHPFFKITALAASERSAGKRYGDATRWLLDGEIPPEIADMELVPIDELAGLEPRVVFSALPSDSAKTAETELAARGKAVFTNAAPHRMDNDVPLLIPEVNPGHLSLTEKRGKIGFIVANGNCSSIILTLALDPLFRQFGLVSANVFTQQALSGAGYPGVPSLDILDNVMPHISGEEDKLKTEPAKMLGTPAKHADFEITPTTTRVNVSNGHLITVHAVLQEDITIAKAQQAWEQFRGNAEVQALPSAPQQPIHVFYESDRPQPRRDRDIEQGMAISVGRVRQTIRLGGRAIEFVVLGDNTRRGAAGQSVLNAELAYSRGLI